MEPIPGIGAAQVLGGLSGLTGGSAAPSAANAESGSGIVYHGSIKSGINVFVFIGALLLVGAYAFKAGKK